MEVNRDRSVAVDYINTLGAGAGFNTKELVTALVNAERAPKESSINNRITESEAKISALASAVSNLNTLSASAKALNDRSDFQSFNASNSQTTAFSVSTDANTEPGSHSVTVSSVAREQRTNLSQHGGSDFTGKTQLLNSGTAFSLAIEIGDSSTVTHTVNVTTTTPQGIVDAINAANIDVTASLMDKGTAGTNYIIQLTGQSGSDNQFTVTPSVNSMLASDTPSGATAANAALTVNGVTFSRPTNTINDIIEGLTLSLNSITSGAASIAVTLDTSTVETNIRSLVNSYNATKAAMDELTSRDLDGALAGDSVFRQALRSVRNIFTGASSTPGTTITRLSDLGISITKTGTLDITDSKLSTALSDNFEDVRILFSADTDNQTELGTADRGVSGDLTKLIHDLTSSTGYLTAQTKTQESNVSKYEQELENLDERMQSLQECYERQYASMNSLIEELNNTKDNLVSSFENLPFTNKD